MIKDQTELTKTVCMGISVVNTWDKAQDKTTLQRASFQLGLVGVDSLDHAGSAGNEPIAPQTEV